MLRQGVLWSTAVPVHPQASLWMQGVGEDSLPPTNSARVGRSSRELPDAARPVETVSGSFDCAPVSMGMGSSLRRFAQDDTGKSLVSV
jgi:hypothetical protein